MLRSKSFTFSSSVSAMFGNSWSLLIFCCTSIASDSSRSAYLFVLSTYLLNTRNLWFLTTAGFRFGRTLLFFDSIIFYWVFSFSCKWICFAIWDVRKSFSVFIILRRLICSCRRSYSIFAWIGLSSSISIRCSSSLKSSGSPNSFSTSSDMFLISGSSRLTSWFSSCDLTS